MIESISRTISIKLKSIDPDGINTSVEVMSYAIGVYLNFILTMVLTLTIGLLTNSFLLTLLSISSFCLIRLFSGGFHFSSLTLCTIATAALIAPIPHIELTRTYVLLLTIITALIFMRYSPNMDQETTNMNQKHYPLMKLISTSIVCLNFIVQSDVLALTFLVQGVLIIPIWKGGAEKYDEKIVG